MRLVVQRVSSASVTVGEEVVGSIGPGMMVLVGVAAGDDDTTMKSMAAKILNLRIFDDAGGKMNLSLMDTGGELLAVSQFTLYADCRKGRRPSYAGAAPADAAREMFTRFVEILQQSGVRVQTGRFQAMMDVALVNAGPVTILLDSDEILK